MKRKSFSYESVSPQLLDTDTTSKKGKKLTLEEKKKLAEQK